MGRRIGVGAASRREKPSETERVEEAHKEKQSVFTSRRKPDFIPGFLPSPDLGTSGSKVTLNCGRAT